MNIEKTRTWIRVTKALPCPICEKSDWCGVSDDGELAVCMRIESEHPARNGGWTHLLIGESPIAFPIPFVKPELPPVIDAGALIEKWRKGTTKEQYITMAKTLGLSPRSLHELGAAYATEHAAWAFPMFDARCARLRDAIGIRLRNAAGEKWAVKGSRSGFFFPFLAMRRIVIRTVLIVEGPTDACAALDMDLFPIGRASCRGGEQSILSALSQLCPDEVVIVYDNDGPGVDGADVLAALIAKKHRLVRFVPPTKDLRSYLKAGGNRVMFDAAIKQCVREAA